jgi:hypothetical protein
MEIRFLMVVFLALVAEVSGVVPVLLATQVLKAAF